MVRIVLILVALIVVAIAIWVHCGYIEYQRFYYQMLVLLYLERNELPWPKPEDFELSKAELMESKWSDIREVAIYGRFPLSRIPMKYIRWLI